MGKTLRAAYRSLCHTGYTCATLAPQHNTRDDRHSLSSDSTARVPPREAVVGEKLADEREPRVRPPDRRGLSTAHSPTPESRQLSLSLRGARANPRQQPVPVLTPARGPRPQNTRHSTFNMTAMMEPCRPHLPWPPLRQAKDCSPPPDSDISKFLFLPALSHRDTITYAALWLSGRVLREARQCSCRESAARRRRMKVAIKVVGCAAPSSLRIVPSRIALCQGTWREVCALSPSSVLFIPFGVFALWHKLRVQELLAFILLF